MKALMAASLCTEDTGAEAFSEDVCLRHSHLKVSADVLKDGVKAWDINQSASCGAYPAYPVEL